MSAADIIWPKTSKPKQQQNVLWHSVLTAWVTSNAVIVCCRLTEAASGYITLGIIFFVLRHRNRRRRWRHRYFCDVRPNPWATEFWTDTFWFWDLIPFPTVLLEMCFRLSSDLQSYFFLIWYTCISNTQNINASTETFVLAYDLAFGPFEHAA